MYLPASPIYIAIMRKTSIPYAVALLMAGILMTGFVNGQPGFSRLLTRFHFRVTGGSDDSVQQPSYSPYWFPVHSRAPSNYFAALNPYGISGWLDAAMGGATPIQNGSLRWDAVTSGDPVFRKVSSQVGLVRRIAPAVWMGLGLGFSYAGVRGYGSRWDPSSYVSVGGLLGSKTYWAMSGENFQILFVGKQGEGFNPMRIRVGLVQPVSERLSIYGGLEWETATKAAGLIRANYCLTPQWSIALGWGWNPDQLVLSVNHQLKRGWLSIGMAHDPVLGSSVSFLTGWNWGRKK